MINLYKFRLTNGYKIQFDRFNFGPNMIRIENTIEDLQPTQNGMEPMHVIMMMMSNMYDDGLLEPLSRSASLS